MKTAKITSRQQEILCLIKQEIDCGRNPSTRLISEKMFVCERTIRKHLIKMQDAGVIQLGELCVNITIPDQLTRIERLENTVNNLSKYITNHAPGTILSSDEQGVVTAYKINAHKPTYKVAAI